MLEAKFKKDVLLSSLTTFGIGGPAKLLLEVENETELKEALLYAEQKGLAYAIIGGGSNVLASDEGFSGLLLKMKTNKLERAENKIVAAAGVPLARLVNFAASQDLSGLEGLIGIPGTVGGAVRGNAGAFGAEAQEHLLEVRVWDAQNKQEKVFTKEACQFGYRQSVFKQNPKWIILEATFELLAAAKGTVKAKTQQIITERTGRGLGGFRSAGSFFVNPEVGADSAVAEKFRQEKGVESKAGRVPAGWLVEEAGCLGKTIGGAQMSEQHANYLINTGSAKASDVVMLASYVKNQVRDKLGVQLQEEVSYLGF